MLGRLPEVVRLEREEEMARRSEADNVSVATAVKTGNRVFVGHGGDQTWREVKDFLVDRSHLEYEEFNREATAGISTAERLQKMLDESVFALIVMTAEDEHGDGKRHARENVVHEIGLFQGRVGFRRAIVLLEDGCEEFSNIEGVRQIRFQRGRVSAKFEEIRRTLDREGLMSGSQDVENRTTR
jgi:predicted nucleotide-binding protein